MRVHAQPDSEFKNARENGTLLLSNHSIGSRHDSLDQLDPRAKRFRKHLLGNYDF